MSAIPTKMTGAILPGNSTLELKQFDVPTPGHGEVLLRTKASTICGSDIRAIYHEHLGKGPEGYQPGMIAGHEPSGQIVEEGPGLRRFKKGDRVIVYHISGCGVCNDCRRGYMISCTSPFRRAYGWQRDGGMAEYLLAEEKDLVLLPDSLTYADGAQVACGFGTVYEGLEKIGISGNDAVLVTGLGPVGLATAMLAKAMGAQKIIGTDVVPERLELARELKLCDEVLVSGPDNVSQVRALTGGNGVEKAIDCSANDKAAADLHPGHPQVGQDLLSRRRRLCFLPALARYHPRSKDHLRFVGHEHLAHGRVGRTHRPLEHPPRNPDHPSLYPRQSC